MTIRDLKKDVEALGFSAIRTDDDSLAYIANRALRMIYTYHPKIKRASLGFSPESAIFHKEFLAGEGTEVSLSIPAGRLKMTLQGEGQYTTRYGNKSFTYRFSCGASDFEVIFPEDGELIFSSDSLFCAWDLSVFKSGGYFFEDAVTAMGDILLFDLKKIYPDLVYLLEEPKSGRGEFIHGLSMTDTSHFTIPKSYRGVISLIYAATPQPISEDSEEDEKIDISEELSPLLPFLVAYFLWLDEEPDIAKGYLAQFEKLSREIKQSSKISSAAYVDTNRWS